MTCALALAGLCAGALFGAASSGHAHNNSAQDYVCYAVAQKTISFCVPQSQALIRMDVEDSALYAHYENGLGTYTVSISDAPNGYTVPQTADAGYAATQHARRIAGVNPPARARAFTRINDKAIIEIEASDDQVQAFFVEVHTPEHIVILEAIDYSIEFEPDSATFENLRSDLRYGLTIHDYMLATLSPLQDMETLP